MIYIWFTYDLQWFTMILIVNTLYLHDPGPGKVTYKKWNVVFRRSELACNWLMLGPRFFNSFGTVMPLCCMKSVQIVWNRWDGTLWAGSDAREFKSSQHIHFRRTVSSCARGDLLRYVRLPEQRDPKGRSGVEASNKHQRKLAQKTLIAISKAINWNETHKATSKTSYWKLDVLLTWLGWIRV